MPVLSVWAIRLSLLYFVAGTTFGAVLLAGKALPIPAWMWAFRSLHVEALLFGFVFQLAIGVAFWILPRTRSAPDRRWMIMSLIALNLGVLLVATSAIGPWGGLALVGRICETAAAAGFALHAWPRVRGVFRGRVA